ncbi:ferric reductase NAD binding domain-containing protein [Thelonectria olida]|uniref:Ferric reductase NAD binding domain-containing protein n=1 Tax=Thelonectria olida TaxID=1576542 RepID=A0A9P8WHW5_9HYPO|nr:ferric reductase NAD binding domain-containing protein [Thelonectria olida]
MAGGTHKDPNFAAKLARRSELNHEAMLLFAAAMSALFGIVLLFHLPRTVGAGKTKFGRWLAPAVFISRKIRNVLLVKFPGVPSVGHLFVVIPYVGINIVITFVKFDNNNLPLLSNVASRTGWMTMANTLIVILLSLKNTPLAVLSEWSYERLNIFHRISGFATVVFVIVHACSYTAVFGNQNFLVRLTEPAEIYGIVAGLCFLFLGVTGAVVRKWWYELFYYLHIVFWMLGIIMVGLHQPEPAKKVLFLTCAAAGFWVLDRLIRVGRLVVNGTNNSVTVIPLPRGGTRLVFSKCLPGDALGKHAFLWIPKIRALQTHPFTIAATDPLELVVSAKNGFTRALHEYATHHPGANLKCSLDGPYGSFPNPKSYDKVILVAGGSGASFTIGAALRMLRNMGEDKKSFTFIWMVQHPSCIAWFSEHLNVLKNDPRITIHIYVTRQSDMQILDKNLTHTSTSSPSGNTFFAAFDSEKAHVSKLVIPPPRTDLEKDMEKDTLSPVESPISPTDTIEQLTDFPITYHRPDVSALIKTQVEGSEPDESLLIMGCGPQRLMTAVRNATAENVRADGPGIELHCEQFGW